MKSIELQLPHSVNLKSDEFPIEDAVKRLMLLTTDVVHTERVRLKCAITILTLENGHTLLHFEKELIEEPYKVKLLLRKYYGLSGKTAELLGQIIVVPYLKTLYNI